MDKESIWVPVVLIRRIHKELERLWKLNDELRESNARLVRRIAETKALLRKQGGRHE